MEFYPYSTSPAKDAHSKESLFIEKYAPAVTIETCCSQSNQSNHSNYNSDDDASGSIFFGRNRFCWPTETVISTTAKGRLSIICLKKAFEISLAVHTTNAVFSRSSSHSTRWFSLVTLFATALTFLVLITTFATQRTVEAIFIVIRSHWACHCWKSKE